MAKKINVSNDSTSLKLNKEDGLKILRGAAIALGGAALTYATDIIPTIEWGEYKPIVVAISAILINAAWKLIRGK